MRVRVASKLRRGVTGLPPMTLSLQQQPRPRACLSVFRCIRKLLISTGCDYADPIFWAQHFVYLNAYSVGLPSSIQSFVRRSQNHKGCLADGQNKLERYKAGCLLHKRAARSQDGQGFHHIVVTPIFRSAWLTSLRFESANGRLAQAPARWNETCHGQRPLKPTELLVTASLICDKVFKRRSICDR